MNIININVPNYVNYISDWVDLQIPQGHFIMDKTITGCGFTEYFLRNTQNIVLCSPRKVLLENKSEQHGDEIFYVKNETEKNLYIDQELELRVDKESLKPDWQTKKIEGNLGNEEEKRKYITQLKQNISDYIDQRGIDGKTFKILVTYDSLRHVLEVLRSKFTPQAIDTIQFVVDEFQSIFIDSKFKGNVELDFVDYLQDCYNVCYLSATPMIEKYLDKIPEFNQLPYYKLIWDPSKVVKAKIIRKKVRSIFEEIGKLITQYRDGQFPRKIMEDKSIHESKELVFYVNSVKTICSIVKKFGLTPSETNIICSQDDKNKKKLKTIKHQIGTIPLQGQAHKMFTFCTRTVYLGADFYSTSAYTVVCSDCNIETLAVDISLDLPQILGRQRLKSNIFRNECLLFYKTQKKPITKDDFDKYVEQKRARSFELLTAYQEGSPKRRAALYDIIKQGLYFKYRIDYMSIRSKTDTLDFNKLVELSEERAWEVSQVDYQDDITVKRILEGDYILEEIKDNIQMDNNTLECDFMFRFNSITKWDEKMRIYCDFLDSYYDLFKTTNIGSVPREFQNYVNLLGTKRIKALKYRMNECENEYRIISSQDQFKSHILYTFSVGRYPISEIKVKLQQLYDSLGVKKRAKATDLGEYFEIKSFVTTISSKAVRCIELLKLKE